MASDHEPGTDPPEVGPGGPWSLIRLSLVAAAFGAVVGVVGGTFRRLLFDADGARVSLVTWAHHWPLVGWIAPVLLAAGGAALARLVVRLAPLASGSGVQHVEAVWRGEAEHAPWTVLPAKFFGGLIAIGSGLALGREGPTVHMGAAIGSEAGRCFRVSPDDRRVLQAALGGAGLAVAFNAPLGGSLFVFEEIAKSFRLRLTLATLIGSATAIVSSRVILGNQPDFLVGPIPTPTGWLIVVYVVFGAATGALGVGYNRLVVGGVDLFNRLRRPGPELRAAVVGAVVGLILWFDPILVGGGDRLAQRVLGGGIAASGLLGYFLIRFVIGPLSYSPGTPGGLFAPLLVVGAVWGALVHGLVQPLVPALGNHPAALAIVGMATFFAAVVRAPLTGIALIVEMTATTTLLVPLFAACFAAVLVATLLRGEPIYDSLRVRMPGFGPR